MAVQDYTPVMKVLETLSVPLVVQNQTLHLIEDLNCFWD